MFCFLATTFSLVCEDDQTYLRDRCLCWHNSEDFYAMTCGHKDIVH